MAPLVEIVTLFSPTILGLEILYLTIICTYLAKEGLVCILTEACIGTTEDHHMIAVNLNSSTHGVKLEFRA
jgi:hypothetical protein